MNGAIKLLVDAKFVEVGEVESVPVRVPGPEKESEQKLKETCKLGNKYSSDGFIKLKFI